MQLQFEELIIVDNTHLHSKHKSFIPKFTFASKTQIKLLKINSQIDAQRLIMKTLKEELKQIFTL